MRAHQSLVTAGVAITLGACSLQATETALPALDTFCLEAQRVVVRVDGPEFTLVNHPDSEAFVLSKAIIEPLTIQQYVWYAEDATDRPVMISCKLKSADHLNETFGAGTAGPPGECRDMNLLTYERVVSRLTARSGKQPPAVIFDPDQTVGDGADAGPDAGMGGPEWLKPFEMTLRDADGRLHVRSKGFRVDWLDPRFSRAPARFRGVQYCHFIAPSHLEDLLTGAAEPGVLVGIDVSDRPAPAPHGLDPASP